MSTSTQTEWILFASVKCRHKGSLWSCHILQKLHSDVIMDALRSSRLPSTESKDWNNAGPLCPSVSSVWRSHRGEKGQDGQRFHTGWRGLHSSRVVHHQEWQGKKREDDLSKVKLLRVLTRTKNAARGLFTGQLTNGKCETLPGNERKTAADNKHENSKQ